MCHYNVKNGLGISDDWPLATEICSNIAGAFSKDVVAILAKPLVSTKDQMHIDMLTSTTRKIT